MTVAVDSMSVLASPQIDWAISGLISDQISRMHHGSTVTIKTAPSPFGVSLFIETLGGSMPYTEDEPVFETSLHDIECCRKQLSKHVLEANGLAVRDICTANRSHGFEIHIPRARYRDS